MIFATKILDRGSLAELDSQSVIQASLCSICFETEKLFPWVLHNLPGTRDTDLLLRRPIALQIQQFCFVFFSFLASFIVSVK